MDEAQLPPPIHQPTETGSPSGSGGQASTSEGGQEKPRLEILTSRNFPAWLNLHKVSLGFSTYQSGKLYLVGLKEDNRLSIFERTFNRCMGLWSDGQTIWASTVFQLWRFENCLAEEETDNGYDRLYVPRMGYTTGDCDIHDIALDGDGRVVFINTLFGCLATTSDKHCFKPLWHPPFLSKLAAEDRCHLNGLAVVDGRPKFAIAVSQSDVVDGWREHRRDGGCLMDIETNEIISSNLSMPHSPRWYDGHLWLLDSGSGFLGQIEPKHGAFEALTFCPGYARGLAFHGDYAVVGVSKPRHNKTFSDSPSMTTWKSGTPKPGAASSSSTSKAGTWYTGFGWKVSWRNCMTSSCYPACGVPRRSGSRPTKFAIPYPWKGAVPSGGVCEKRNPSISDPKI